MEIVNLNNHTHVSIVKQEIEEQLKNTGEIETEMSIPEFVSFLNLQASIYVKNDTVIPFRIYNDYIFIVAEDELIEELDNVLNSISYSLSSLKEINMNDVYLGELDKYEYCFIVDSKYMVNKQAKLK